MHKCLTKSKETKLATFTDDNVILALGKTGEEARKHYRMPEITLLNEKLGDESN